MASEEVAVLVKHVELEESGICENRWIHFLCGVLDGCTPWYLYLPLALRRLQWFTGFSPAERVPRQSRCVNAVAERGTARIAQINALCALSI